MNIKYPAIIVLLFLSLSCATIEKSDPGKFIANRDRITKAALLPLTFSKDISRQDPEVNGFDELWRLEFYERFQQRITFINDIKILFPGKDFDVTPDMLTDPNYADIMAKLQVDAVIGFELVRYNEASKDEIVAATATNCACALLGGGTPIREQDAFAWITMHNYYLNIEDYRQLVKAEIKDASKTVVVAKEQRAKLLNEIIDHIAQGHPLSNKSRGNQKPSY